MVSLSLSCCPTRRVGFGVCWGSFLSVRKANWSNSTREVHRLRKRYDGDVVGAAGKVMVNAHFFHWHCKFILVECASSPRPQVNPYSIAGSFVDTVRCCEHVLVGDKRTSTVLLRPEFSDRVDGSIPGPVHRRHLRSWCGTIRVLLYLCWCGTAQLVP